MFSKGREDLQKSPVGPAILTLAARSNQWSSDLGKNSPVFGRSAGPHDQQDVVHSVAGIAMTFPDTPWVYALGIRSPFFGGQQH